METENQTFRTHPTYSVHPAVEHARAMIRNLPGKTGKSMDEWAELVRSVELGDAKAIRQWLKTEHGLGGTTAAMIAGHALGNNALDTDPDAYLAGAVQFVEKMYDGPKALLWDIHVKLIALGQSLGSDVRICPCKTIVPLYRNHVFAEIKPATRTRVDLGLALKGETSAIPRRLLDTGGEAKGDRITHRFAIAASHEVDDEVQKWLRIAYKRDA